MSDALILGLAAIISASVVTPVVAWLIRRSEARIGTKVDAYHKEINSKLSQLVVAEKAVSHEIGRQEGKEQQKEETKKQ